MNQCCEVLTFPVGGVIGPPGIPGEAGIQGIQGIQGANGLDGVEPFIQSRKFVRIFFPNVVGSFTLTIYESELSAAGLLKQDVYGNTEPGLFDVVVWVKHSTNPQINPWANIKTFASLPYPNLVNLRAVQNGNIEVDINNPFQSNPNFLFKIEVLG